MPLADRLETRFGRFAIPNLIQAIAGLQMLTLVVSLFMPPDARQAYAEQLSFNLGAILQGQVWRLVTYIFVVKSLTPIWGLVAAWFLMWLGRGLEEAWGAFRVNLYVLGGLIPQAVAAMFFAGGDNSLWIHSTVLFAAACIYPNEEILLMFVLPVKLKWIAWLDAAFLALMVLQTNFFFLAAVVLAHVNFLIVFGPAFVKGQLHMAKVTQRRQRYESAQMPENTFFHKCHVCGKTDVEDPTLDFRVTEEGEEICSKCRVAKAGA
jgi:hypothetical protein